MMTLTDISQLTQQVEQALALTKNLMSKETLMSWFMDDFAVRFCWSSGALEGNTLSLEEIFALIEYDEVRAGHTYTEYQEAKNLFRAIQESMLPFSQKTITEEWIQKSNGTIRGTDGSYRTIPLRVGTQFETVYFPPAPEQVPTLMQSYMEKVNFTADTFAEIIELTVRSHLHFERIHPFSDGNGRTGRMILNQQLINPGLLPITIHKNSDYRQAFKRYDKNGDISLMVHVVLDGEREAIQRLRDFQEKATKNVFTP
jgi:Fic family protein